MEVKNNELIQFVNFINECCEVIPDEEVADWIHKPHPDLNMESPFNLFKENDIERVLRLLYFIEMDEADK
jgi:hypothetical protein